MNFEELKKVNEDLAKIKIKGKNYVQVHERIKGFRMLYPNGSIQTKIIDMQTGSVLVKAEVYDGQNLLGTGHAYEEKNGSQINKLSYVENAETSRIGRALAMVGIGIDNAVASGDEMRHAIDRTEETFKNEEMTMGTYRRFIDDFFYRHPEGLQAFLDKYKIRALDQLDQVINEQRIDKILTLMKAKDRKGKK